MGGYQHYYSWHRAPTDVQWAAILARFRHVVEAAPLYTRTAGGFHDTFPLCIDAGYTEINDAVVEIKAFGGARTYAANNQNLQFQGCHPESHTNHGQWRRTMRLEREPATQVPGREGPGPEDGAANRFVTGRRPHDLLVCALLLICENESPGCWTIRSDGGIEDWQPAIDLVQRVYGDGYRVCVPAAIGRACLADDCTIFVSSTP